MFIQTGERTFPDSPRPVGALRTSGSCLLSPDAGRVNGVACEVMGEVLRVEAPDFASLPVQFGGLAVISRDWGGHAPGPAGRSGAVPFLAGRDAPGEQVTAMVRTVEEVAAFVECVAGRVIVTLESDVSGGQWPDGARLGFSVPGHLARTGERVAKCLWGLVCRLRSGFRVLACRFKQATHVLPLRWFRADPRPSLNAFRVIATCRG